MCKRSGAIVHSHHLFGRLAYMESARNWGGALAGSEGILLLYIVNHLYNLICSSVTSHMNIQKKNQIIFDTTFFHVH